MLLFVIFSAGLDGVRFMAANNQTAALQAMVNQQNALRSLAASGAAAQPANLGGAPLILANAAAAAAHHRLQLPPTTQAALLNGAGALAGAGIT